MTKKEFKTHIQTKWKFYLVAIFVALAISSIAVSVATYPERDEKVVVFLTCYQSGDGLKNYMDSIKPDYLEIIDLNVKHKDDDYFGTAIKGYREISDIIIVPESKLDYILLGQCLELSDDIIDGFTSNDFEYYIVDGVNYGIKIYSKDTKEGILSDLVLFNSELNDEDCYLFINKNSLHLGDLNSSEYSGAIDVLKGILNYEAEESK